MNQITVKKNSEGVFLVESDDGDSSETIFTGISNDSFKFLVALADFLMFDPDDLIDIGYEWRELEEEE